MSLSLSLDDEIESLEKRAAYLRKQLEVEVSTLLASKSVHQLLNPGPAQPPGKYARLRARAAAQHAHNQQSLYRLCAGLTTFAVRDPDPAAVDGGTVLGLRVEAMARGRFVRPYYVLLNRPYGATGARRAGSYLCVHRHTVPPYIPLAGLAARYLPPPPPPSNDVADGDSDRDDGADEGRTQKQDLPGFARALRREIVRYHNRLTVVADLRDAVGLGQKKQAVAGGGIQSGEDSSAEDDTNELVGGDSGLLDVFPADAETKQISLQWKDGRTGRLVMDDDGDVLQLLVFGEGGVRDRDAMRSLTRVDEVLRVEEVAKRLAEGVTSQGSSST